MPDVVDEPKLQVLHQVKGGHPTSGRDRLGHIGQQLRMEHPMRRRAWGTDAGHLAFLPLEVAARVIDDAAQQFGRLDRRSLPAHHGVQAVEQFDQRAMLAVHFSVPSFQRAAPHDQRRIGGHVHTVADRAQHRPEFLVVEHFMLVEHLVDQAEQVNAPVPNAALGQVGERVDMGGQRDEQRVVLARMFGNVGASGGGGDLLLLGEVAANGTQKQLETSLQFSPVNTVPPLLEQHVDHGGKIAVRLIYARIPRDRDAADINEHGIPPGRRSGSRTQ
ncbi:MAG: hypothetical protein VR70_14630 [Rhodospirillaceae bacterium BRH_c57]|nr:MAG: hypothetical protein VR70_14630 [Rhodospirillaceae bacterium BRH_c57]